MSGRTVRQAFAVVVAVVIMASATTGAQAAPAPAPVAPGPTGPAPAVTLDRVPAADRDTQLGAGWERSEDLAWWLSGDSTGLHVLTARAGNGYAWREVANLTEAGFDTDRWIGHGCLTGTGGQLVVAYAPRSFDNDGVLSQRGAFLAVVDLARGSVRKLATTASLAYFSPACGRDDTAVVTQEGTTARTRLIRISARTGRVLSRTVVTGQVTSAIPVDGHLVAARGSSLISIRPSGSVTRLARTGSLPFKLVSDGDRGVVFAEVTGRQERLRRWTGRSIRTLAVGTTGQLDVAAGSGGRVFLTGVRGPVTAPRSIRVLPVPPSWSVSSTGRLAITQVDDHDPRAADPDVAAPVTLRARVLPTDREVAFRVVPGPVRAGGAETSPALRSSATMRTTVAGSGTDPVDADRSCAIPRNDAKTQVYQPTPRQVEWAADQAVVSHLTVSRPANWKSSGLPAYTPQGLFPAKPLAGGGRVNVQILLGILAQESNLWQASNHALSGEYGNPLIGNFYGRSLTDSTTDWSIDWAKADCGYGIAQVTDGMTLGSGLRSATQQRAIAVDYAANIAAGLQILQDKWNQTYTAGVRTALADPSRIESWFFAVWAYNSGFHDDRHDGSPWGVGWLNNPVNPHYPQDRAAFLETSYDDARNPERWPYQEKVIGWAGHPIETVDGTGYRYAWWVTAEDRASAKPPTTTFCSAVNSCYPGQLNRPTAPNVSNEPAGPCAHKNAAGQYDLLCYYHSTSTWKPGCASTCGNETLRFDTSYPEQPDGTHFPASCSTSGLPSGALVVDDLPASVVSPRCGKAAGSAGSFALSFGADSAGHYPSKIDFHQVGGGYGGHFWFAHTRNKLPESAYGLKVTGTWTLGRSLNQWARVLVHLPDHGAQTRQATYQVSLGNGTTKSRTILQRTQRNGWVPLGSFGFAGVPKVTLASTAADGTGSEDIAWDAVAFQPLTAKPKNFVVALGDSFSSGEGSSATDGSGFYAETDVDGDDDVWRDACHRSRLGWPRKAVLKDSTTALGARTDAYDAGVDFAFLACSGAETENLLPTAGGVKNAFGQSAQPRFHELPQLDRGFLDADTTLVTLTVGGNDARFGTVLKYCISAEVTDLCQDHTMPGGDTQPLKVAEPALIKGNVRASVLTTLREIHRLAPAARIVLMGYPELVARGKVCVDGLLPPENTWINDMSVLMDQQLAGAAADATAGGARTTFADPVSAFSGRGVCGAPESVNNLVLSLTPGDKGEPSAQSFHPNAYGTDLYGGVLNTTLRQLGY